MRHSFLKTAARTNKDSDGDAPAWSAVTGRAVLDLENEAGIAAALDRFRPWAVINAAGWVRVDEAEGAQAACHRVNAAGAIALARACAARGIGCLNVSSDLVFDGSAGRPYVESDLPTPLDAYGRSKAAMEAGCDGLPGVLVVRTAAFFSPLDPHNFAVAVADALAGNQRFAAAGDHVVTPTFVPSLVDAALDLLIDGADGRWHPAGDEALSWANFARRIAMACGYDPDRVDAVAGATLGWRAPRPTYAALASERGAMAGSLVNAIEAFASGYHATRRGGAPAQDSGNPGQRGRHDLARKDPAPLASCCIHARTAPVQLSSTPRRDSITANHDTIHQLFVIGAQSARGGETALSIMTPQLARIEHYS